VNNQVDRIALDTAAAVGDIALSAWGLTVGSPCWRRLQEGYHNLNRSVHLEHPVVRNCYRSWQVEERFDRSQRERLWTVQVCRNFDKTFCR